MLAEARGCGSAVGGVPGRAQSYPPHPFIRASLWTGFRSLRTYLVPLTRSLSLFSISFQHLSAVIPMSRDSKREVKEPAAGGLAEA